MQHFWTGSCHMPRMTAETKHKLTLKGHATRGSCQLAAADTQVPSTGDTGHMVPQRTSHAMQLIPHVHDMHTPIDVH